jgi:hypothetical protein
MRMLASVSSSAARGTRPARGLAAAGAARHLMLLSLILAAWSAGRRRCAVALTGTACTAGGSESSGGGSGTARSAQSEGVHSFRRTPEPPKSAACQRLSSVPFTDIRPISQVSNRASGTASPPGELPPWDPAPAEPRPARYARLCPERPGPSRPASRTQAGEKMPTCRRTAKSGAIRRIREDIGPFQYLCYSLASKASTPVGRA